MLYRYPERPEKGTRLSEAELASHFMWMLGTELQSFGRAARALNHLSPQ